MCGGIYYDEFDDNDMEKVASYDGEKIRHEHCFLIPQPENIKKIIKLWRLFYVIFCDIINIIIL